MQLLLRYTNGLAYIVVFCINVLANSGSLWSTFPAAVKAYNDPLMPALWAFGVRDLLLFLQGCAVLSTSMPDPRGWRHKLTGVIGFRWQIYWAFDTAWLLLLLHGGPISRRFCPLCLMGELFTAASTVFTFVKSLPDLNDQLMEAGFTGFPVMGYALYVLPSSISTGWMSFLVWTAVGGSEWSQAQGTQLSASMDSWASFVLVISTCAAMMMMSRHNDIGYGAAALWFIAAFVTRTKSAAGLSPDKVVGCICFAVLNIMAWLLLLFPEHR